MGRFEKRRGEIEKKGATIAAVSVDSVPKSQALAKRLDLHYPILSDPGGAMIRSYGVWHADHGIALPAIFIVGPDGRVAWRRVSGTITDRPDEDDVIDALSKLTGH